MYLNQDYKLIQFAGQYYLISVIKAEGPDAVMQLSETAGWILSAINGGMPREKIASEMTEEFDVDWDRAEEGLRQFLDALVQKGILTDGPEKGR